MNEEKFSAYALPRVVAAVVIVALVVWGTSFVLNFLSPESDGHAAVDSHGPASVVTADAAAEHAETGAAVTEHALVDSGEAPAAEGVHDTAVAKKKRKKAKNRGHHHAGPLCPGV